MESFFPSIWNLLHDGNIARVERTIAGDMRVHVSIEYLRERFEGTGDKFIVTLLNCTEFSFRFYEAEHAVAGLDAIASESLSILSAEMVGPVCRVFADVGVIEFKCDGGSIKLDSGRQISLEDLIRETKVYWDQWGSKSKE